MAENNRVRSVQQGVKTADSFAARIGFAAIGLLIGLLLGAGGVFFFQTYNPPDEHEGPEILAASVVFERIQSQNEMVSASQKYSITEKVGDTNKIPFINIPIPFTDNSFWYRYVGVIKVGVNLENADFKQDGNVITISLDSPSVSSNTPDMDQSGVLEENNNILNPIHIEDVDAFRAYCVEQSEVAAIEGGIIKEARANTETNIRNMFNAAVGDEYTIEFEWRDQL